MGYGGAGSRRGMETERDRTKDKSQNTAYDTMGLCGTNSEGWKENSGIRLTQNKRMQGIKGTSKRIKE